MNRQKTIHCRRKVSAPGAEGQYYADLPSGPTGPPSVAGPAHPELLPAKSGPTEAATYRTEPAPDILGPLMDLLNTAVDQETLLKPLMDLVHHWAGCHAVGIRLRNGEDFPYFETRGFSSDFVCAESRLCAVGPGGEVRRNADGRPVMACVCGAVIAGRLAPDAPCVTAGGSFWTGGNQSLRISAAMAEKLVDVRYRCRREGYESVALVPLRYMGETFGLLQFNDHRMNRFSAGHVRRFERLADSLALGLTLKSADRSQRESERRLSGLLGNLPGMAYRCGIDSSWEMTFVSGGCAALTGYTPEELIASRDIAYGDLVHEGDRQRVQFSVEDALRRREHFEVEYRLRAKNGELRWVWERGAGVFDKGAAIAIEGFITDISGRRRTEQALERRVIALTKPTGDTPAITFDELFDLAEIQELQDLFAKACNVGSVIVDPAGAAITQPSNFCRLCKEIIRKTPAGLENCRRSDAAMARFNPGGPAVGPCLSCGFWEASASITVGGKHVANWLVGHVRNPAQKTETLLSYAQKIGADRAAFENALKEVPVMDGERFEWVGLALFSMARQLSTTAFQNVQHSRFIADSLKMAEEVRRSEERYRTYIDHPPAGILI